jgi:hypothetical protein
VVWAIPSKVDPVRDVFILPNTPFDSLNFAREKIGLGGRMGINLTTKMPPETDHKGGEIFTINLHFRQQINARNPVSERNRVSQDKFFVQILWGLSGIFRTLFLVKTDNFLHISSRVTTLASG